jgi:hypothetical protein
MQASENFFESPKSPTYIKVHHNGIKITSWHSDHIIKPWARIETKRPQYRSQNKGLSNCDILHPSQNISKKGSTNTLTFVDHFLLIFWDGGSMWLILYTWGPHYIVNHNILLYKHSYINSYRKHNVWNLHYGWLRFASQWL